MTSRSRSTRRSTRRSTSSGNLGKSHLEDKGLQPVVFDYDYDDEQEHDGGHTSVALPIVLVKH